MNEEIIKAFELRNCVAPLVGFCFDGLNSVHAAILLMTFGSGVFQTDFLNTQSN
jgi:hypothetical protein